MPPLGAHMSIAGGYYKAVDAAAELGMDVVQLFTKNNNQWRAKPISAEDVSLFRDALARTGVSHPVAHASYLINLASPDDALWAKSLDSFVVELERCDLLGVFGLVFHPGSYTTSSEEEGLQRIVAAIDEAHRRLPKGEALALLECTAGQGTNLGWRLEHLAYILDNVADTERMGVCLDTCHLFAAGYGLATEKEYKATMRALNKLISVKRVKAIHLNDSKREFGSRVDRHEHIGRGEMGLEPFRRLLNDRRFGKTPMYLETPKGDEKGEPLDAINLRTLRSLAK